MGQGMDGMNESWEPEDVEESQQRRVNTLLPEPQRLRIEADGLFKRAKKAEEKNKALATERDHLRAENERLKSGDIGEAYNCGEQKIVDLLGAANAREKQLRAEVERLRGEAEAKEDGFWGRMAGKCANERDIAAARAEASEKDAADCRAEYRELLAKAGAMSDKLIAAESTVAGLRRALEEADKALEQVHDEWAEPTSAHDAGAGQAAAICFAASMAIEAALAASPGDHERQIKSEALEEFRKAISQEAAFIGCSLVTKEVLRDLADQVATDKARQALLDEANRLEAMEKEGSGS